MGDATRKPEINKAQKDDKTKKAPLRLEKLKEQRQKLDARIQKMEALSKVEARKQDVRRKILIGAYYLNQAIKDGTVPQLREMMNGFLTRESDKKLFWDFEG